jgi:putative transposase
MPKHDISRRRACRLVSVDPKTVRRERPPDCPEIQRRMREIAGERRRFGYRRIGLMLKREGITMNHMKLRRLYREEGLAMKLRRGRERATGTRAPLDVPRRPNDRWSLDFLADVFELGRRFRIFAAIDDCTRKNLGLVADTRRKLAIWRYDYNTIRPHSGLNGDAPTDARRALEQFDGSAHGARANPLTMRYAETGLSL